MNLRETYFEDVNWMDMVHHYVQWQILVLVRSNPQLPGMNTPISINPIKIHQLSNLLHSKHNLLRISKSRYKQGKTLSKYIKMLDIYTLS
jgi:hypothetical protein